MCCRAAAVVSSLGTIVATEWLIYGDKLAFSQLVVFYLDILVAMMVSALDSEVREIQNAEAKLLGQTEEWK